MNASDWISVKDRLPEKGSPVLVLYKNSSVGLFLECAPESWSAITHWQPLVLPFKPDPFSQWWSKQEKQLAHDYPTVWREFACAAWDAAMEHARKEE